MSSVTPGHRIFEIRKQPDVDKAVIFIHGFSGSGDETWGFFPTLIGTDPTLHTWDIFSLGYATSFLPDIRGIWAADPDIPILAINFRTQLDIQPLTHYRRLAIVAHSMGGLVVQRTLLDDSQVAQRVSHLILFGTPSGGVRKAGLFGWLKPQIRNMKAEGEFITQLRQDWRQAFNDHPSFEFITVAGDRDQFVPPDSSLNPFARRFQRVVAGDHLSMVKPRDSQAESIRLLMAVLSNLQPPASSTSPLRIAAEQPSSIDLACSLTAMTEPMTEAEIVQAAVALDLEGKRADAIALLLKHQHRGTDVQGTLAGRIKRRWLQTGEPKDAQWAVDLYQSALQEALKAQDHDQVYYHAINVAFLRHVAFNDSAEAHRKAQLALDHCRQATKSLWSVATEAEAYLYLGDSNKALSLYQQALAMQPERWQLLSTGQQAYQIASKLENLTLQEELRTLFNPESRQKSKIFISYSHRDSPWLERLRRMMSPYLRTGELELWVDTRIPAGSQWFNEITQALKTCKVAVLLVTADFLASDFVCQQELPVIFEAADRQDIKLLWVYVAPALYEETPLTHYQAAHDIAQPLARLSVIDQEAALKAIAIRIRSAVYE